MRLRARNATGEAGAATTEFALTSLILVPTLLYAIFLYEMSFAKLKANEASRYLVWEMTAYGLSDFQNGDHASKFNKARTEILNEVKERYGDGDLDGATPKLVPNYKAHTLISLEATVDTNQVLLTNEEPQIYDIGGFSALDDVVNYVFGFWKFNKMGKAKGEFRIHIKNKLLGRVMPIGYTEKMLTTDEFDLSSTQSLVADQWDVKDGKAVAEIDQLNCASDYCKQVSRMHLAGLTGLMGSSVDRALGQVGKAVGVHLPLLAVVESMSLGGSGDSQVDIQVSAQNMQCHEHHPVLTGMTNVYKDRYKKEDSRYYQIYNKLGPCYMGCNQALKQEAGSNACPYNSRNTDSECK
jgi:hypothetical protein